MGWHELVSRSDATEPSAQQTEESPASYDAIFSSVFSRVCPAGPLCSLFYVPCGSARIAISGGRDAGFVATGAAARR
jgi:hypothetical protein